jgi:hypothetical protein
MDSRLYTLARLYADAIERADGSCVMPGTVLLLGAAPMPPDALIVGSYVTWTVDGVKVHAMTEPTGLDVDLDTLLQLVACARGLEELAHLGEWLLRHEAATGRTQIGARGATAHLLCAVPPQDAQIVSWSDAIHMHYLVGDDLLVSASSPIGVAYA